MSGTLKVGVIGLGGMAQLVHLPILSKLSNIQLTAIAEINRNRLKTVGQKYPGSKQYLNYEEMLQNEDLDAVVISTPTDTHREIALRCIKAKKNILIEKPIARNYKEAKEIIDAANKSKVQVMVGMNFRFRPDAMLLRSVLNSGELGDIYYVKCGWIRKKSSNQKWFLNKKLSGGGVLIDLGVVILDLALWMLGENKIKAVSVRKFNNNSKSIEDSAVGLVRLDNGKVINFEVSWEFYSESDSFNLIAHGTKGSGSLNPLKVIKKLDANHLDYSPYKNPEVQNLFKKSFENELKHFVSTIQSGEKVISSGAEALVTMKLLDAIYKSAEHNREIKL